MTTRLHSPSILPPLFAQTHLIHVVIHINIPDLCPHPFTSITYPCSACIERCSPLVQFFLQPLDTIIIQPDSEVSGCSLSIISRPSLCYVCAASQHCPLKRLPMNALVFGPVFDGPPSLFIVDVYPSVWAFRKRAVCHHQPLIMTTQLRRL
jgi:hypothetical protein